MSISNYRASRSLDTSLVGIPNPFTGATGDLTDDVRAVVGEEFRRALIYGLRAEPGLSQRELAERMGTTQSVISRIEEGSGARYRPIVLGEAFAEYAWTRWTVDAVDHQSRITGLQRLTLEHVGLAFGEVWVTTCNGIIESVALWTDSAG